MDYTHISRNFLLYRCDITSAWNLDEVVRIISTFIVIFSNIDNVIDDFGKNTHAVNIAQAMQQWILSTTSTIINMKDLLCELKDRYKCGDFPYKKFIQVLDDYHIHVINYHITAAIQ